MTTTLRERILNWLTAPTRAKAEAAAKTAVPPPAPPPQPHVHRLIETQGVVSAMNDDCFHVTITGGVLMTEVGRGPLICNFPLGAFKVHVGMIVHMQHEIGQSYLSMKGMTLNTSPSGGRV